MGKLINFICFLLSGITLVAMIFSFGTLMDAVSIFGDVNLLDIGEILTLDVTEELVFYLAMLGSSMFMIFGFPLVVFLVSLNGLRH